MPKLTGVFELFRYLDQIPISDINRWLKTKVEMHALENFIGNRILYPQTLPMGRTEMQIDLAILREAIKRTPEVFFDRSGKKIIIPEEAEDRFGSLFTLIKACIEAVNPTGVRLIYVKRSTGNQLMGSILSPEFVPNEGVVTMSVNNQVMGLKAGQISLLPFRDGHLLVKIGSSEEVLAAGGSLGLMVDLRKRGEDT